MTKLRFPFYRLTVWEWNGTEYEPHVSLESENIDEVYHRFDLLSVSVDRPQMDLYVVYEEYETLIDRKD